MPYGGADRARFDRSEVTRRIGRAIHRPVRVAAMAVWFLLLPVIFPWTTRSLYSIM